MLDRFFDKTSVALIAGTAAIAALVLPASPAQASPVVRQLGAGWVATWDSSQNVDLLVQTDGQSADALILKKVAVFTTSDVNSFGGLSPIAITFQRQSVTAPQFLVIGSEEVTNQTGQAWNGFTFAIEPSSTKAAFDPARSNAFSITPFTNAVFSDSNRVLTLTGGTVPSSPASGNIWTPGATGELVINSNAAQANQLTDFVLKEQPNAGPPGPPPPPSAIPLPAAAWSGLSGLLTLVVVGAGRNLKMSLRFR